MRVSCVQSNVVFDNPVANLAVARAHLEKLGLAGTELAIFPEAFLTGYCVDSREAALDIALEQDHDIIKMLQEICDRTKVTAVVGFAEKEGDRLYNTAAICEPRVATRFYRKSHLPELGLDKFVDPGDELEVFDTHFGKLGVLICYDLRVPEASRVLALKGADIIALPTNWPNGAQVSAEHVCIARAAENKVFFATCNRVGHEHGFDFIGLSKIIDVKGNVLAPAGAHDEIISCEVDLADARAKRTVTIPDKYEIDVMASRRPGLYGPIVE
jgi:predicted amidohydrolase